MIRSPFRLQGTDLAPVAVLIARILALSLLGQEFFHRHLPYLPWLDPWGSNSDFRSVVRTLSRIGLVLLLFPPWARLGSFLIGGVLLTGLLACRPCQSVGHTYVACALLILALSSHRTGVSLLRLQVVVLYGAATLNKALDIDWWNGRYFETLMIDRHGHALYAAASALLPGFLLPKARGIAGCAIEAAFTACFLRPAWYRLGVAIGVAFHGGGGGGLNGALRPLLPAILASDPALLGWPARVETPFFRWAPDWEPRATSGGVAVLDGRRLDGLVALQRLLLVHPAFYYAIVALLHPRIPFGPSPATVVLVGLACFSPALIAAIRAGVSARRKGEATRAVLQRPAQGTEPLPARPGTEEGPDTLR